MYRSMASSSSATLVKLSRLMRLSKMSRKKRSTMFSHSSRRGLGLHIEITAPSKVSSAANSVVVLWRL